MRFSRKLVTVILSVATLGVVLTPGMVHAKVAISMGTPSGSSNWQAGANLSVNGLITWDYFPNADPPVVDQQPNGAIVFIHAGTNDGPVTNSAMAGLSGVTQPPKDGGTGDEEYSVTLVLTAAVPPLNPGGNNPYAQYFVEADATWKSIESLHNKSFSIGMRTFPFPSVDQAYIRLCKPATFFMISV